MVIIIRLTVLADALQVNVAGMMILSSDADPTFAFTGEAIRVTFTGSS
jgi:hypothetical protein